METHADLGRGIEQIKSRLRGGRLDALVNNAAISPKGDGGSRLGAPATPGDDGFRGLSSVEDWAFIDRTVYDLLSAFGWNLKENSATQVYISGNLGNILDPDVREKEVKKAQKAASS